MIAEHDFEFEETEFPKYVVAPASFTPEDEECLAHNIYFEAKNQNLKGQFAVGIVTLNRVADPKFPNTICGAVKHSRVKAADNGLPARHKCQFSWYCDGLPDRPYEMDAYQQAQAIASALLDRDAAYHDFTEGADHYHADYIEPPYWTTAMYKVAQVDNHIFYRRTQL